MRILLYIVFGSVTALIGYHLYGAEIERRAALANLSQAIAEQESLETENAKLIEDIEYYQDPHNLEKELRARFNYRAPNEDLIIVVPSQQ